MTDGACLELAGKVPKEGTRVVAEEEMLVRRAQRGDRVAFDALVRLHDQKILRLVMQIVRTPELAKDLYQEAILKAYRALGNFRFESSFSTWLHRVATNVCLDYLRRQGNREEISTKPGEDGEVELLDTVAEGRPDLNPEHALRAREIGRRIEAALQGLTPRERVVFELRHYQGLRLRAIGELCGTTEETAKNCLFRATQKLRTALEDLAHARKRE